MALTRKFLKSLGIGDDQIDTIIEEHVATSDALKKERDDANAAAAANAEAKAELDKLKGGENWQQKYEDEHSAFESYKSTQAAAATKVAKEKAFRQLLKDAGVSEKRIDSVVRVSDLDGIELDGDKVKDAEALSGKIKEEWADFIVTEHEEGADVAHPPKNGGKDVSDPDKLSDADLFAQLKKG